MNHILRKIQVNIPFTMLYESYLPQFLEYGLNPEIGFDAAALDRFSMKDFEGVAKQIRTQGLSTTLHAPYLDLSPSGHSQGVASNRYWRWFPSFSHEPLSVTPVMTRNGIGE